MSHAGVLLCRSHLVLTNFCYPCDPSLGSLGDISPAQIYCADLNSVIFFLLPFIVLYFLNKTYISLSIFEYPKFSLSPSAFLCLCSTFFLAVFYLSPLIFFISYHLLSLSASVFLFLLLSFFPSTFFLCLSSFIFPLFSSLPFCVCAFYYYDYYPVLFCIFYLSTFVCLFFAFFFFLHFSSSFVFLILFIFSTLFDDLALILDFNYCKFSLLFIFFKPVISSHSPLLFSLLNVNF